MPRPCAPATPAAVDPLQLSAAIPLLPEEATKTLKKLMAEETVLAPDARKRPFREARLKSQILVKIKEELELRGPSLDASLKRKMPCDPARLCSKILKR